MNRRGFIGRMLAGITAAAVAEKVVAEPPKALPVVEPELDIALNEYGKGYHVSCATSCAGMTTSGYGGALARQHIIAYQRYLK